MNFLKTNKKILLVSIIILSIAAASVLSCGLVKVFIITTTRTDLLYNYMLSAVPGAYQVLESEIEESKFAGVVDDLTTDSLDNITLDTTTNQIIVPSIYKDETGDLQLRSYLVKFADINKTLNLPVDENGNLKIKFDQNTLDYFNSFPSDGTSDTALSMAPVFSDPNRYSTRATVFEAAEYKLGQNRDWTFKKDIAIRNGYKYLFVQGVLTNIKTASLTTLRKDYDVQSIFFVLRAKENQSCDIMTNDDYKIFNINHQMFGLYSIQYINLVNNSSAKSVGWRFDIEQKGVNENGVKIMSSPSLIQDVKYWLNSTTEANLKSVNLGVQICFPSISESVAGSVDEMNTIKSILPNSFIDINKKVK